MEADTPRFILFLPPAPSTSFASLKHAFGDTISQVLKEVASHASDSSKAAVLEIALSIPELVGKQEAPRSSLYDIVQSNLAGIYKLVCVLAAQSGINVEDDDGVDVRIIPVAWSQGTAAPSVSRTTAVGPFVDLITLARSGRQWQYAFGVESKAGEAMVQAFVAAKGSGEHLSHVGSGNTASSEDRTPQDRQTASHEPIAAPHTSQRHRHVAVGGTFDHLHVGHKLLLTMTVFAVDEPSGSAEDRSATIGITGDQLLTKKKHAEVLQSWDERQHAVQRFLDSILNFNTSPTVVTKRDDPGPNAKSVDLTYPNGIIAKCTEIQDPFGPTITEEQISAIIISGETRSGGKAVNDKRKEKGWTELEVFEVDVLDADDEGTAVKEGFESKLSSTAIREKLARKHNSAFTSKV
jgi:phosphopantetheine adenylyltransferase